MPRSAHRSDRGTEVDMELQKTTAEKKRAATTMSVIGFDIGGNQQQQQQQQRQPQGLLQLAAAYRIIKGRPLYIVACSESALDS